MTKHAPMFRRQQVGETGVFYREAGPQDVPVLLLHDVRLPAHHP